MNTQTEVKTQNVPEVKVNQPVLGDFGNGRYSALAKEAYRDAKQVFRLSDEKADKLARQIASDFGACASRGIITMKSAKVSKVNDDGKVTVSEAGSKVKNCASTNALLALRALKFAGEAGDSGILFGTTVWAPCKQLVEYFDIL